ncbi:F390 synthetase-related protein [Gorillibacterium sp. sgz5001074]|uniref:F390 synthetase-related protein n=1 Tax=Gorillibacterium sp. sgz5001074 TaxID=3446695 RepID=UPI003F67B947
MRKIGIFLSHYWKARYAHRRWTDREHLLRWQEERILRHIDWVRERSSYYRELWEGYASADWRSFPVIGKAQMMDHFDRLNTAGISREAAFSVALQAEQTRDFASQLGKNRITVGLSSGTSGNRGLFLVSEEESVAWAGTVLGKVLPGPLWRAERVAFFLRANSNLYESVRGGRLMFRFFDLLTPTEQHLVVLNRYRPTLLVGPPSVLRLLAEAAQDGKLKIGQPNKIVSVAEALDPMDEALIRGVFGRPVHQIYQCTEGLLAATCELDTLHLNEDLVHIGKDVLDQASGRYAPVITDFTRRTQPIIRYRLDDVLLESGTPCGCGSPFAALTRIEGRCDDLLYWPRLTDGGPSPVFPDFITRSIIQASDSITEYRAVQHTPVRMEITVRLLGGGADEQAMEQVKRALLEHMARLGSRLGCRVPDLTVIFCEGAMHQDQAGKKLRRVERRFALEQWGAYIRE